MNWQDVSVESRNILKELGNFSPTVNAAHRDLKGYTLDADGEPGKCYYSSDDLREIAKACIEAADWLDKRAMEGK